MGLRTKILKLILLTAFIMLPDFAVCADIDPLKAISARDYATEREFGQEILKAFDESEKNRNLIQCGNRLCDLNEYYCIETVTPTGLGARIEYSCKDKNYELRDVDCIQGPKSFGGCPQDKYCYKDCFNKEDKLLVGTLANFIETTGSDGREYKIQIGTNSTIQYGRATQENGSRQRTAFFGCEVLPVKLFNYNHCFFCGLVGVVYDGSAKLADVAFGRIARSLATLLILGFAIWLAIHTLAHVSALTKQDAPKFMGALLRQGYKVLIAFVLLQNPNQIFKYAVRPILDAGLAFGQEMLVANAGQGINVDQISPGKPGGKYLNNNTYQKVEKYVVAVQAAISKMQAVGSSMVCVGGRIIGAEINFFTRIEGEDETSMGDGFSIFAQGLVMTVFGFLLSLAFTFYLLDAIIQMGIFAGLLPFLIACWPFKATSGYTKTGADMFMNSVFVFIFVGLVVSLNVVLIDTAVATKGGGLMAIAQSINDQSVDDLLKYTDITGMDFLILVFCCIFGFQFMQQASSLAGKFAKGPLTGKGALAPGIATMGASAAKNLALNSTKSLRGAVSARVDRAGKAVLHAPSTLVKGAIGKIRGRKNKG